MVQWIPAHLFEGMEARQLDPREVDRVGSTKLSMSCAIETLTMQLESVLPESLRSFRTCQRPCLLPLHFIKNGWSAYTAITTLMRLQRFILKTVLFEPMN